MRKIIFFIFVLLVGCGSYWFLSRNEKIVQNTSSNSDRDSSVATFKISEKVIQQDEAQFPYTIDAKIPEITSQENPTVAKKINQVIDEMVKASIEEFKKNVDEVDRTSTFGLPRSGITFDYTIAAFNSKLISFEINSSEYISGAAHPNNFVRGLSYDLIHDRQIKTVADVFRPDANFLPLLSTLSREDLKKQLNEIGEGLDEQVDGGTEPKLENFQDFVLTIHGLRLIFNAYQVAPYAAGMHEVNIFTQDIKDLLPEDSVLFLFQ